MQIQLVEVVELDQHKSWKILEKEPEVSLCTY